VEAGAGVEDLDADEASSFQSSAMNPLVLGGVGACRVVRPGASGSLVAAIIGSWLPGVVICGGSRSVAHVCCAFGLTAGPGASMIPVSRGAMGRVWCLDLGAERYALKELFWESDEESVRPEVAFTAHLASAGIRLPGSLPGRGHPRPSAYAQPDQPSDQPCRYNPGLSPPGDPDQPKPMGTKRGGGFNRSTQHRAGCLGRRVAGRALLPGCASRAVCAACC
jgi:hypothetical protein